MIKTREWLTVRKDKEREVKKRFDIIKVYHKEIYRKQPKHMKISWIPVKEMYDTKIKETKYFI